MLNSGGVSYLKSSFSEGGAHSSPGNSIFDAVLKKLNRSFGIRNTDDLTVLSEAHGQKLDRTAYMPSSKLIVV